MIKAIVEVVAAGGNVLIPAFALGRAQEIILAIRTSALFHSVNVPVYVDGLVREVTDLFQNQLDLLPASHKSFAVDSAISSGMDCCAVCEFFDGYLCRGEESPLYKRDVDPAAKCPAFVRQAAAVESIANGEELVEAPILVPRRSANEEIDLDLDEDELND